MRNGYRHDKNWEVMLILLSALLFNCQWSIVNSQSSIVNRQSQADTALMARAARAEGLDKSVAFQRSMEAYKQNVMGEFLFDKQGAATEAGKVLAKTRQVQGDKLLLIRQIFHALPQHVRQVEINQWQARMDSVSGALAQGADFEALMRRYSDMQDALWMSRLDMTEEMEQVAFALQPGQVSAPFLSPSGIHILQVVDQRQRDAEAFRTAYTQQVKGHAYPDAVTEQQIAKLKSTYKFQENQQNVNRLYRDGKVEGTLFTVDGKSFTGAQFAKFAQTYPMGVRRQYAAFVAKCVLDCSAQHLDENPAYVQNVESVADRLLAQEAYKKHVQVPSQTDEAGLSAYFSTHQKDYRWQQPRFRGAIIHAADKKTAKKVSKIVKKLKGQDWAVAERQLDDKTRAKVHVEQGVFEQGTNAFVDDLVFGGRQARPLDGYPVALSVGKKINGPDDYNEVRAKLQQDYEQYLANEWLSALRKQK